MRSFADLTKLFCRLDCFNKCIKYQVYNFCKCHPNCKTLNFNPKYDNKNIRNYRYGNTRKCGCKKDECKVINKMFDV